MSKLSRRPAYITQEIVDTSGSMGGQYTDIGDVQEYVIHHAQYSPANLGLGSATPRR